MDGGVNELACYPSYLKNRDIALKKSRTNPMKMKNPPRPIPIIIPISPPTPLTAVELPPVVVFAASNENIIQNPIAIKTNATIVAP